MAKTNTEDLLKTFEDMTVLELAEFLKAFEEKFEVTAAAPMAVAVAAGDGGGEAAEAQSTFDVMLTGIGEKKIQVIKEVRSLTGLGLKEAKDLVESAPSAVLEGQAKEAADAAVAKLVEAGATAEAK